MIYRFSPDVGIRLSEVEQLAKASRTDEGCQLEFNGRVYEVRVLGNDRFEVKRVYSEETGCFERCLGAVRDFFQRWSQAGFSRACVTRAQILEGMLNGIRSFSSYQTDVRPGQERAVTLGHHHIMALFYVDIPPAPPLALASVLTSALASASSFGAKGDSMEQMGDGAKKPIKRVRFNLPEQV